MAGERRGILLITTMLMVAMVVMLTGSALMMIPSATQMAGDARDQSQALAAAEAGITYAQARWQTASPGIAWQGDGSGTIVDTPGGEISVLEDKGNVIGVLTGPDGEVSEFLLRFNPQDGSNDPSPNHWIRSPHISLNNLLDPIAAPVLLGDGSNWARTTDSSYPCPPYTACLLVEGRAGEGLRAATPDNPYPAGGNQRVVSRLVECHLGVNNNNFVQSALYAGNGLNVTAYLPYDPGPGQSGKSSGGIEMNCVTRADVPRLLVNGNVNVTDGTNPNTLGTNVKVRSNGVLSYNGSANALLSRTDNVPITGTPQFPALDWSQVLMTVPPNSPQLNAGTYMWRPTGAGKKLQLYYYNQNYEHLGTGWSLPAPKPTIWSALRETPWAPP